MASEEHQMTEFKSLLDEVRKQLFDAKTHFDIWVQLWPTEESVEVLNRYKGFFLYAREAHLDRFFIKVDIVTSRDVREPSIYHLLRDVNNTPNLAPDIDVQLFRNRLGEHKNLLRRIKQYRNKRAAHWDMTVPKPLDPVLYGESKQLLRDLVEIFNEIHRSHTDGGIWAFQLPQHDDTSRLLDNLKGAS